jgi:hypothetical protein
MWNKDYEGLNSNDKNEFRRIANHLLSHTYLTKYSYEPSKQMTLPNKDYQFATRFFSLLEEYFSVTGWRLDKDDNYGFMSLINIHDNNRFRMDQFTTLFLYTCRLIYEEQREQAGSFHIVFTSTHDIVEKMKTLGLLKNGKSTQKERLEAQRALAHFNIIEKMETTAWEPDGNHVLIMPSILAVISNQGINDMILEMEELHREKDDEGNVPDEDNPQIEPDLPEEYEQQDGTI